MCINVMTQLKTKKAKLMELKGEIDISIVLLAILILLSQETIVQIENH